MSQLPTKPVLHYFDIGSLGRGEVVRLFLQDAGIKFEDKRYSPGDNWAATSTDLQAKRLSRTGKVPVLEYNGAILNQHIPILRYLARELGSYEGKTSLEKYVVDAVADIYIDWRSQWASQLKAKTAEYKNDFAPKYYKILAEYYSERAGPYLLGSNISYADFAVYQSIDNDENIGTLPAELPEPILKFKKAFEARPRIQSYLASGRSTKS
ncbi:glutathione S-transferase [Penicillium lagena]|uniref:glutathione S-transferase n=1 Tax=Penicillium lagena TaxID=94218 RepID=UPI00254266DD|nr:glutathione S-transferase [Penicillium lagena]XP_056837053.1 glutathione S-transferase [Penicillium lagena]KAJ5598887.1 glutathione S-transferase [Penicillium lagena]KAJ5623697.1 glutathione S-transferase [Penicillium lagena]